MGRRRRRSDPGPAREFVEEARRLKGLPPLPPGEVHIRIKRDHPQAKELVELASLLAERQKDMASGLVIQRNPVPEADTRMIALLEKMGVNMKVVMEDLKLQNNAAQGDPFAKVALDLLRKANAIVGNPDGTAEKMAEAVGVKQE